MGDSEMNIKQKEGVPVIRLMLIVSSLAPLFIMLSFRGASNVIPDSTLWIVTASVLIIPSFLILIRIISAQKKHEIYELQTSETTQNKEYLFTYLFTILLPLYSLSITTMRELLAVFSAILFVILVLWNMNLHYVNILFALFGYKIYTLKSDESKLLISSKLYINSDITKAHRISNSVYIEVKNYDYSK